MHRRVGRKRLAPEHSILRSELANLPSQAVLHLRQLLRPCILSVLEFKRVFTFMLLGASTSKLCLLFCFGSFEDTSNFTSKSHLAMLELVSSTVATLPVLSAGRISSS